MPTWPRPREEDEVAGLQVVVRDGRSVAVLGGGVVGQRDADLGVDVQRRARSSRRRSGLRRPTRTACRAPASRCPTTPPYCDGGSGRDQGIGRRRSIWIDRGGEAAGGELRCRRASRRGGPLLRRQPCLGLPLQLRLPARLLGLQLLDLALDPGEHLLALGELALDRLLLARALGHDLGLVLPRRLQALTTLA